MLQDFKCVSDHFGTLWIKGLILVPLDIIKLQQTFLLLTKYKRNPHKYQADTVLEKILISSVYKYVMLFDWGISFI